MKNNKFLLIGLIAMIIIIDVNLLFGSNRLSAHAKFWILLISSVAELCSIFAMAVFKPSMQNLKEPFGLKAKFYSIVLFLATTLYTIGIWNMTPATPNLVKETLLGTAIIIQLSLLVYFCLKKTKEFPDERFYSNLAISASLMFVIALAVLIMIAFYIQFVGSLSLLPGYIYILIGLLLLMFALAYYYFEERR
ncbi:hypothetical protein A9Q68_06875 [Streptococcus bovimastitidis]|uniref:DUF3796 domain-containing protein n=1 Tax=Streptococcus bovimastitidis TaxID=1856638 RepID=A0A1L8MLZ6_9STRE|nr:hypothetical protein [Streptococcus bovimastitidis]OJF71705.1 hypothetical protein A9Q68_06875 [Streptococcus bovimastitidis]